MRGAEENGQRFADVFEIVEEGIARGALLALAPNGRHVSHVVARANYAHSRLATDVVEARVPWQGLHDVCPRELESESEVVHGGPVEQSKEQLVATVQKVFEGVVTFHPAAFGPTTAYDHVGAGLFDLTSL